MMPAADVQVVTGLRAVRLRLRAWWRYRIMTHVPRLVWPDDEIDVTVTFTEARLPPNQVVDPQDQRSLEQAMRPLMSGIVPDLRRRMAEIGIKFDHGVGFGGHDWEWDWSLRGPISVRFRGRCKTKWKRH